LKKTTNILALSLCAASMVLLIFDAKQAMEGAKDGLILCLYTVIPTLFPYCVLSILFRSMISGRSLAVMRPLERFIQAPSGYGSILLLGMLGGYPTGAICMQEAIKDKSTQADDAKYLRAFCNNAGPSFIIGIVACCFKQKYYTVILILIQVLSALLCCLVFSKEYPVRCNTHAPKRITLTAAIKQGSMNMANVCGIIVLFRAFMNIIDRHMSIYIQQDIRVIIVGILELTNGITLLPTLKQESLMFVTAAGMLSFGGLCVTMQTLALSSPGSGRYYIVGKMIQSVVSMTLAVIYLKLKSFSVIIYVLIFGVIKFLKSTSKNKHFLLKNSGNFDIHHV